MFQVASIHSFSSILGFGEGDLLWKRLRWDLGKHTGSRGRSIVVPKVGGWGPCSRQANLEVFQHTNERTRAENVPRFDSQKRNNQSQVLQQPGKKQ